MTLKQIASNYIRNSIIMTHNTHVNEIHCDIEPNLMQCMKIAEFNYCMLKFHGFLIRWQQLKVNEIAESIKSFPKKVVECGSIRALFGN